LEVLLVLGVVALAMQGLGLGFFQVAYMEIVLAASPLAHRGVAGSLSMLTRTIGVVTGASVLTLGFHAVAAAARGSGMDDTEAFLTAFRTMFRAAGVTAALIGAVVAWSARRR